MATQSGLMNFKAIKVTVNPNTLTTIYTPSKDSLIFVNIDAFQNQNINNAGLIYWESRGSGEPAFGTKRHLMYGNVWSRDPSFSGSYNDSWVYNGPFVPAGANIKQSGISGGPSHCDIYIYIFELDTDAQNLPYIN